MLWAGRVMGGGRVMAFLTHDELKTKCLRFAKGRAGARKFSGSMDPFLERWWPTVAGNLVNCGDRHPTPPEGFASREDAVSCARTYKLLCREWLEKNTPGRAG